MALTVRRSLLAIALVAGSTAAAHAQTYSLNLVSLAGSPFVDGGAFPVIGGLSDDGKTVAGTGLDAAAGQLKIFRWSATGGYKVITLPSGYDSGTVVGFSTDLSILTGLVLKADGSLPAATWNAAGTMTVYQGLSGDPNAGTVKGASDNGSVLVGEGYVAAGFRAATFKAGSPATNAGLVPGYGVGSSYILCSSDGNVKFAYAESDTTTAYARKVGTGAFTVLPKPAGVENIAFHRVNPDGTQLVGMGVDLTTGAVVPLVWTLTGGASVLSHVPGQSSQAYDLSTDGSRIAGSMWNAAGDEVRPVIWENGTRIDLLDLLAAHGFALPPEIQYNEAKGIAADGTKILGHGIDTNLGIDRFWIATIPPIASTCYADCDGSGTLSIDDFICFQTLFALGDPAADCDDSSGLSIDDFICFQTSFALGC